MSYERRKIRVGRVVSDRMDKSVVVAVEWRQPHRLYRKSVKKMTKFNAHDADNECRIGDTVRIIETRPLSKTKRWKVVEVLSSEDIAEVQPEQITVDESVLVRVREHPEQAETAVAVDEPPAEVEAAAAVDESPVEVEAPVVVEEPPVEVEASDDSAAYAETESDTEDSPGDSAPEPDADEEERVPGV